MGVRWVRGRCEVGVGCVLGGWGVGVGWVEVVVRWVCVHTLIISRPVLGHSMCESAILWAPACVVAPRAEDT